MRSGTAKSPERISGTIPARQHQKSDSGTMSGRVAGTVPGSGFANVARMDQPRLLTIDQAAERLNVTPRFIRRLIAERRIGYLKIGKFIRFHSGELDDWVERQRIEQLDRIAS